MTISFIATDKAPAPFSNYSQAVQVPPGARTIHVSGQVGVSVSGKLPSDPEQQHELAWRNVFAILDAAGMDRNDIVDVRAFVTGHDQVPIYRIVRDRLLEGAKPASTLVVAGLADPDWLVEIAVTAAKVEF
ncbi:MAG: RidA family protein [Hyphomicrobiaceae bacterium]